MTALRIRDRETVALVNKIAELTEQDPTEVVVDLARTKLEQLRVAQDAQP